MSYEVVLSKPPKQLIRELFNHFNGTDFSEAELVVGEQAEVVSSGSYNSRIGVMHPGGEADVPYATVYFNRIDLGTLFSVVSVGVREVDIKADGSVDPDLVLAEVSRKYGMYVHSDLFGITKVNGVDHFYAKSGNPAFVGSSPLVIELSLASRVETVELNGFYLTRVFEHIFVDTGVPTSLSGFDMLSTSVQVDNFAYFFGNKWNSYDAWKLNLATLVWTKLPNMPLRLREHIVYQYDADRIALYGGYDYITVNQTLHCYRISTNTYQLMSSSPTYKHRLSIAKKYGDVWWTYGGIHDGGAEKAHGTLRRLNQSSNTSVSTSISTHTRHSHASEVVGDWLYVLGGLMINNDKPTTDLRINLLTYQRQTIAKCPGSVNNNSATLVIEGQLYVIDKVSGIISIYRYDDVSDTWTTVNTFPHAIGDRLQAFVLDDRYYIVGNSGNIQELV